VEGAFSPPVAVDVDGIEFPTVLTFVTAAEFGTVEVEGIFSTHVDDVDGTDIPT
jgi:hypothetical protein